jgi:DNA helicase II / ATP-dependent DNA helicase PcrA
MEAGALLSGLNEAQRRAVTTPSAPLRILAGAGSGKTRVLTRRIAHRVATDEVGPEHVLALTFTRKAAGELTHRLRALGLRESVAAGTFHAIAYAQLRQRWADRGVRPPTLLDRKVGFVARLLPRSLAGGTAALDVVGEIEWAKARMVAPGDYVAATAEVKRKPAVDPTVVAATFERYEHEKRTRRLVDFDDLLRLARRDLDDAEFAAARRWRFRHLFVDEFQDVNPLQYALLRAWIGDRADLCVVGDPNQAIYAWNGADARYLERFDDYHPGGETVSLVDNYRSSPQILAVANAVLATGRGAPVAELVPNRPDGPIPTVRPLDDDGAEARAVARAVRDAHRPGGRWNDQAVLARTNAQLVVVEEALRKAQVPYRIRGGGTLLDQPEVAQALRDLGRRAGAATREVGRGDGAGPGTDGRGVDLAAALADLEASARRLEVEGGDQGDERAANLEALVRLGRDYRAVDPAGSVPGFLAWLTATTRGDQPDGRTDAVDLTTFHAAKGLEWGVVHVVGLEQGLVPITHARTSAAVDEERRLLYVAVTRAERELHLTWARQRTFGSRSASREPSLWLEAIDDACARLEGREPPARPTRPAAVAKARPRRAPSLAGPDLDDEGRKVFEALKAWRSEVARAAAVPAYVVAHDRTLEAVAAARPRSRDDLLAVPGMGPVKVTRYGDDLLALVAGATAG